MNQKFRMHCGISEGVLGILRVLSTAREPNINLMERYLCELEQHIADLRETFEMEIAKRLTSKI